MVVGAGQGRGAPAAGPRSVFGFPAAAGGGTIAPMPLVRFTPNLARHCAVADAQVDGATVAAALAAAFAGRELARGYVLDEQGGLRKHMSAFVDGEQVRDRRTLSDAVAPSSTIDLIQALSGG